MSKTKKLRLLYKELYKPGLSTVKREQLEFEISELEKEIEEDAIRGRWLLELWLEQDRPKRRKGLNILLMILLQVLAVRQPLAAYALQNPSLTDSDAMMNIQHCLNFEFGHFFELKRKNEVLKLPSISSWKIDDLRNNDGEQTGSSRSSFRP